MKRGSKSRVLAGGTDAEFSAFAARDGGQLVGFALLLTGNRHDAEDLAQHRFTALPIAGSAGVSAVTW